MTPTPPNDHHDIPKAEWEDPTAKLLAHWPPVNPQVLEFIRGRMNCGRYEDNRDELISDLKKDISLFLHCLREIALARRAEKESGTDPATLLRESPLEDFARALAVDLQSISSHTLEEASAPHALQMLRSLVGATVAESVSATKALDPEIVYTVAILRQFGLTLIAWTYPSLYRRSLDGLKDGEEIDTVIADALGFSPSLVGLRFAREWGLHEDSLQLGVVPGSPAAQNEQENTRAEIVKETLAQVCKLGELFANVSLQDEKDFRENDWHAALEQIEGIIGENGVTMMKLLLLERSASYVRFAPDVFKWNIAPFDRPLRKKLERTERFRDNVYIKHCPRPVQEELSSLYSELPHQPHVYIEGVRKVTKELMPLCGFRGGCIYLVEPQTASLTPRFPFGTFPSRLRERFPYASSSPSTHPLVYAFRANAPVLFSDDENPKERLIAGVLGDVQRAGALVVVLGNELDDDMRKLNAPMLYYKALRQTLEDFLDLR